MPDFISQIINLEICQWEILGNPISTWLATAIVFATVFCLLVVIKKLIIIKLNKLANRVKLEIFSILIKAVRTIHWPFYVITSLYVSLDILDTRPIIQQWFYYLFLVIVVYYIVGAVNILIDFGAEKIMEKRKEGDVGQVKILNSMVKILVWILAIIILLANFGYDVSALLAGLGIGGLAVAFASQQILGDLIGAFTIYFDKPFKVGDKIQVGEQEGVVEKIGIRSTRLRTSGDDEIIIPNKDMANTRVKKFE